MIPKHLFSTIVLIFSITPCFPVELPGVDIFKKDELPFMTRLEAKRKQLGEQNKKFEDFQQRKSVILRDVGEKLTKIENEINALGNEIKTKKGFEKFLKEKITKLTQGKHNLVNLKETWTATEESYQNYLKLLEEVVKELNVDPSKPIRNNPSFDISYLRKVQEELIQLEVRAGSIKENRDSISAQIKSKEDSLAATVKEVEKAKLTQKKLADTSDEAVEGSEFDIEQRSELLGIELGFLYDKERLLKISIEKHEIDLNIEKNKLVISEIEQKALKTLDAEIDSRLRINMSDVQKARKEFSKANSDAIDKINTWKRIKESKWQERIRLKTEMESVSEELKLIKSEGREESAQGYLAGSQELKLEAQDQSLKSKMDFCKSNEVLQNKLVDLKKAQTRIVELRFKVKAEGDRTEIDSWIKELNNIINDEEREIKASEQKKSEIPGLQLNLASIDEKIESLKKEKSGAFKGNLSVFTDTLTYLREAKAFLEKAVSHIKETEIVDSHIQLKRRDIINQVNYFVRWLEAEKQFDIWRQSKGAITIESFWNSISHAERFTKLLIWKLPFYLNPVTLFSFLKFLNLYDYIGFLLLISLLFLFYFILRPIVTFSNKRLKEGLLSCHGGVLCFFASFLSATLRVISDNLTIFVVWLFIQLDIVINFKSFFGSLGEFISHTDSEYLIAYFYIFSIFFLLYLAGQLIKEFIVTNREVNYAFFGERFQGSYEFLLRVVLYSTIIMFPFCQAFILLAQNASQFPQVLLAIYTVILQGSVVAFILIHKETVLNKFSPKSDFLLWIKDIISLNYRPVTFFLFVFLVLSNPYIGYFNLAYLLLYAVPLSIMLIYWVTYLHTSMRKAAASWFITEEDGEYIDKFDHAKTYYGIFIVLTVLFASIFTFLVLANIWGISAARDLAVDTIQNKWTIEIKDDKFGLIQFLIFTIFVTVGFVISSLIDRLFLNKMFDMLKVDFGLRNTISSITHYLIIYLAILFGFIAIKLGSYIGVISGVALLGVGLAVKDYLADFIAGFLILIERPVEIGSFIELGMEDEKFLGTVYKISARTITLRNARHQMIIIPNKEFLGQPIKSWTYGRSYVGFDLKILVSYKNVSDRVREILLDIVKTNHRILKNPATICRVDDFDDNGYVFTLRPFISARRAREKWDIASEIRSEILVIFKREKIDIPFQQTVVYLHNEETGELADLVDPLANSDSEKKNEKKV